MKVRTIAAAGLLGGAVGLNGCGMSITPPVDVADPVTVFVADHGIHTSLIIPRPDGSLAQFSYSRFDWAALDYDQWYRSLGALMVPGPGTIGTRDFPGPATRENLSHQFELTHNHPPVQDIYPVPVSAERCQTVLTAMDARWAEHKDTMVENSKRGLRFVQDSTSYSLFHNCNHEVAQWLRDLGCGVSGAAMTADVTLHAAPKTRKTDSASTRVTPP